MQKAGLATEVQEIFGYQSISALGSFGMAAIARAVESRCAAGSSKCAQISDLQRTCGASMQTRMTSSKSVFFSFSSLKGLGRWLERMD